MKKIFNKIVTIAFFAGIITSVSCDKNMDDEYNDNDIFELGSPQKILDGYVVQAIDFDSKGNVWIGTFNQGLVRYNAKETVIFNSDNSAISKDFVIWDIAVDKNDNVWIGYSGEGLAGGLLEY